MDSTTPEFFDQTPDPAILRAERRMRLLEELTEIGMSLARGLSCEAADPACDERQACDPAEAYARLSRAVRLTIALEAKTDQELRSLQAGIASEREEKRLAAAERSRQAAHEMSQARERQAHRLVLDVAETESADRDEFDGLAEALNERLDEDEAYENCGERPLRETVERLCRDLGLHPDWSHWTGEGWDATYDRNPFRQPSRRPVVWNWQPTAAPAGASAAASDRQLE